MKRVRPAITLPAMLTAALRQTLGISNEEAAIRTAECERNRVMGRTLDETLPVLAERIGCTVKQLNCDHDPALRTRPYNPRIKDVAARYTPNANDPACLIWRPKPKEFEGSHDVKTYVRGNRGQLSDTALIKNERLWDRDAEFKANADKEMFAQIKKLRGPVPKQKIPSKPFPKGRGFQKRKENR